MAFTLPGIVFLVTFLLLLGLVACCLRYSSGIQADLRMNRFLSGFRKPFLTRMFLWITLLGKWQIVITSVALVTALLWIWGRKTLILPFLVTIAGSQFLGLLIKLILDRKRPEFALLQEYTPSFPSGHAIFAITFYGFMAYFLWHHEQGREYRQLTAILAFMVLILAIGLSRLYLGAHFATDVLAGYLLGLLWLIIGLIVAERRLSHEGRRLPGKLKKPAVQGIEACHRAKLISLLLIAAQIIFYLMVGWYYLGRLR